jgi:hypothetical protein
LIVYTKIILILIKKYHTKKDTTSVFSYDSLNLYS